MNNLITFSPVSAISFQALVETINSGYEGYVGAFSPESIESYAPFVREQQIDLQLSLVALAETGVPVAVSIVGRRANEGWIGDFAVLPRQRGSGNGQALLAETIRRARIASVRRIRLEVDPRNLAARRLYSAAGFRETRHLLNFSAQRREIVGPLGPIPEVLIKRVSPDTLAGWLLQEPARPAWDHDLPTLLVAAESKTLSAWRDGEQVAILFAQARDDEVDILYLGARPDPDLSAIRNLLSLTAARNDTMLRVSYVPQNSLIVVTLLSLGFHEDAPDLEMELSLG